MTALPLSKAWEGRRAFPGHGHALDANHRGKPRSHTVTLGDADLPTRGHPQSRPTAPGLYKWTSNLAISNDVTLAGGPNDVWILQVAGTLNEASAKNVILTGGAQAKNVFWESAGAVSIGTDAHFEGTILGQTMIAMKTHSSINGRLLAQTAITLQMSTVTVPAL